MKYRLINLKLNQEHLCEKVEIDGFDYYVSDKETKQGDYVIEDIGGVVYGPIDRESIVENPKPIIATNNPNIDLPKVVDEVEKLFWEILNSETPQSRDELLLEATKHGFKFGYNKSQESCPFSEEDVRFMLLESFKASQDDYKITSDEIIQLWKQQKTKTVYYE